MLSTDHSFVDVCEIFEEPERVTVVGSVLGSNSGADDVEITVAFGSIFLAASSGPLSGREECECVSCGFCKLMDFSCARRKLCLRCKFASISRV